MWIIISIVLVTVSVSAVCSFVEAILLSHKPSDLQILKGTSGRVATLWEGFIRNLEKTTAAILSLNTIANTLGASFLGAVVTRFYGEGYILSVSLGMTVFILIFCEIVPKNVALVYRNHFLTLATYLVYGISILMAPFAKLSQILLRFLLGKVNTPQNWCEEILSFAQKAKQENQIDHLSERLLQNTLKLSEVTLQRILTPRTVITAIDKTVPLHQSLESLKEFHFTRIPLFEGSLDHILGFVYREDLLGQEGEKDLEALMVPVPFIPETACLSDALSELLNQHHKMAITIDEFGATTGLVTLEDIFEFILGKEIYEMGDADIDMRQIATERYRKNKKGRLV